MARYDEALTLAQARDLYFAENGFGAAYDDRWIRVRFGRHSVPLFPNTRPRIAAVRIHDLHHVAAEYDTTWVGEGEISAWELAGGCGVYLAAWILNLTAFGIGCTLSPRRMFHAFVRGRCSTNLYGEGFNSSRLAQKVGDVRRELRLDQPIRSASTSDAWLFAVWVVLSLLYAFGGMLSFATFAFAMWKQPRVDQALSASAQNSSAAPAQ